MIIDTYLSTLILTVALLTPRSAYPARDIAPNPAQQRQIISPSAGAGKEQNALQAPKAAFLSIDEYAQKAAREAGVSTRQFLGLIACESNWKEDASGDNNKSFGILQFQKPTFTRFAKKYDRESLDISDSYDQIDLAVLMIRNGYQEHWLRCSRRVGLLQ